MGIFDRLFNALGYAKATQSQIPTWLGAAGRAEGTTHIMPEKWKSQADLYRRLSWVNIAVSITAKSAASTMFSVKEIIGEETQDIINHEFEMLMYRPNPLMSRFEFLESTVAYRSLTGNSYWWLNKPSEDSPPIEQWIIPSHKIEPVPDERMFLKGYLFDPGDGQQIPLEPWEIVHFKSFNPLSMFVGLSPIEALAVVAVGDLKMQDWNTRLFGDNNARLPGILAFADPINDSEWEQLKKDSKDTSKRRQIMMMRNVGKGGVQWLQNASSQKDMEFLAGRQFNKEEIFGIYAPGLASMLDVNATEANAISGRATFNEYCLWPILVSIAEKITNDVLPAYGDNLRGEFKDIRFVDRDLKLQEQLEYSKTHTVDEVRMEFYGEDKLGDLRGMLFPIQIAPVKVGEEKEAEAPEPESEPESVEPVVSTDSEEAPENIESTTGLNGAQITAAVGLLVGVADKSMAPEVAVELLIAVGLGRERAQKMVSDTVLHAQADTTEVPPQLQQFQKEQEEEEEELKAWRRFAIARLGKNSRKFTYRFKCKYISEDARKRILDGLKTCKTKKDVNAVFDLERYLPLMKKIDDGMRVLMEV